MFCDGQLKETKHLMRKRREGDLILIFKSKKVITKKNQRDGSFHSMRKNEKEKLWKVRKKRI